MRRGSLVLALLFAALHSAAEVRTYNDGTNVWYYSVVAQDGGNVVHLVNKNPGFTYSMDYQGEVVIPAEIEGMPVVAIDGDAFKSCGATSIYIPDSVTYLSSHAFQYVTQLETIRLSPNITEFGIYVFGNCYKLKSIELPLKLQKIGGSTFSQCSALEEVTIHNALKSGALSTFPYCGRLKRVYVDEEDDPVRVRTMLGIPATAQVMRKSEIGQNILRFTRFEDGAHLTALSIDAPFETLEIPEEIDGDPVVAIDDKLLAGCAELKSVIMPDSIVTIGKNAFAGCSSLESVRFSLGLESIGDYAFQNCGKLTGSYDFPNLTALGSYGFEKCSSLKSVSMPKLMDVPYYCFRGCTSLEEITLAEEVDNVGSSAFLECAQLKHLKNVKSLGVVSYGAFNGCSSLEDSIRIRPGAIYMLSETFKGCGRLPALSLPAGITTLEHGSLKGCASLETLYLSSSLRTVDSSALKECTSLKTIVVDAGDAESVRTILQNAGMDVSKLNFVEQEESENLRMWDYGWASVADGTISIGFKTAPEGEVIVPSTLYGHKVTNIGALGANGNGAKITRLVLPDTITELSARAFNDCTSLKEIVFLGRWPDMGTIFPEPKERFEGLPRDCVVRAPPQQYSWRYCVQKGWLGFRFEYLLRDEADVEYLKSIAAANPKLSEWDCYVAGLNADSKAAELKVLIDFDEEGTPIISCEPNLGERRRYTTLGSNDLKTWAPVDANVEDYRFYKVSVELP